MAKLSPEERAKDIVSYRIILFFVVAVVSILAMIPLRRYIDQPSAVFAHYPLVKLLIGISALVLVLGVVLAVMQKRKNLDVDQYLFSGVDVAVTGFALLASFVYLYLARTTAANILFFAFPAMTFLAIVFYIYQREFVLTSLHTAISALLLYYVNYAKNMQNIGLLIALIVIIAALGVLLFAVLSAARKNGGYVGGLRFCEERNPWFICAVVLVPAAVLCGILAALLAKALIAILVLAALYVIMLVAYTTKLS